MNSYAFGELVHGKCHHRVVCDAILADAVAGGGASDAVNGYVNSIRNQTGKSRVDARFLALYDEALRQTVIKEGQGR